MSGCAATLVGGARQPLVPTAVNSIDVDLAAPSFSCTIAQVQSAADVFSHNTAIKVCEVEQAMSSQSVPITERAFPYSAARWCGSFRCCVHLHCCQTLQPGTSACVGEMGAGCSLLMILLVAGIRCCLNLHFRPSIRVSLAIPQTIYSQIDKEKTRIYLMRGQGSKQAMHCA